MESQQLCMVVHGACEKPRLEFCKSQRSTVRVVWWGTAQNRAKL